jgi:hypothetical protein
MAISDIEISISYAGDGVSTAFSYPYPYRNPEDLIVSIVDAAQNVTSYEFNSDYTVSGVMDNEGLFRAGGTVNLTNPAPAGLTLMITRCTPNVQATVYVSSDKFPAKVNEATVDIMVMRAQEIGRHFQGYADGFPSRGGPYQVDDWFYIRNAGNFGYKEIICVVAGSPGIWKPLNPIGA